MDYKYKYLKYKNKYMDLKNGGNKPYIITIQNPPQTPWLDWIEKGIKEYEGRLNRGIFSKFRIGDIVIWKDKYKNKEVKTQVIDLKYYDDFGLAFNDLGKKLVPIEGADEYMVKQLYHKYFTPEDIKQNGVVAIKLKVIY